LTPIFEIKTQLEIRTTAKPSGIIDTACIFFIASDINFNLAKYWMCREGTAMVQEFPRARYSVSQTVGSSEICCSQVIETPEGVPDVPCIGDCDVDTWTQIESATIPQTHAMRGFVSPTWVAKDISDLV
jgi:hypothetical protein